MALETNLHFRSTDKITVKGFSDFHIVQIQCDAEESELSIFISGGAEQAEKLAEILRTEIALRGPKQVAA